jgi:hypothetical protein
LNVATVWARAQSAESVTKTLALVTEKEYAGKMTLMQNGAN